MIREERIFCICCPLGCLVKLTIDDKGDVTEFANYKCEQGKDFVIEEYKNPVRVLTTTVLTQDSFSPLLSVRTNKPIPKHLLLQGMLAVAKVRVKPPVKMGEVIIANLLDTGTDIVATGELCS